MLEFSFSKLGNFLKFYFSFGGENGFNLFKVNWKNKEFFVGKESRKIILIILLDLKEEREVEKKVLKVGDDVLLFNQRIEVLVQEKTKIYKANIMKLNFVDKKEEEMLAIFVWNVINNYKEESVLERIFEKELREIKNILKSTRSKFIDQRYEKRIVGLYGELVVLYLLLNRYGIIAYKWWRDNESDKFDFSVSDEIKIEVKTSLHKGRNHRFSHDQLYSSVGKNILIASCLLIKDKKGKSFHEIYLEIKEIIKDDWEMSQDLDKQICETGSYAEKLGPTFNFNLALDTLKFYNARNIPKYDQPEPPRVTNTQYCVFLEGIPEEELAKWIKND